MMQKFFVVTSVNSLTGASDFRKTGLTKFSPGRFSFSSLRLGRAVRVVEKLICCSVNCGCIVNAETGKWRGMYPINLLTKICNYTV